MENYNTHTRPSPHASLLRVTTRCCSCSLFRGMVPFFSTRSTLGHPRLSPRRHVARQNLPPTRLNHANPPVYCARLAPLDFSRERPAPTVSPHFSWLLLPGVPLHSARTARSSPLAAIAPTKPPTNTPQPRKLYLPAHPRSRNRNVRRCAPLILRTLRCFLWLNG